MAAAILYVFCAFLPGRLAAGWGFLVRWSKTPERATTRATWYFRLALLTDDLLLPFKFEDIAALRARVDTAELDAEKAKLHAEEVIEFVKSTNKTYQKFDAAVDGYMEGVKQTSTKMDKSIRRMNSV
jgi:hypothetical protein